MAVSDREIDRAMKYGLEDFDWLWAVVEVARGRRWSEQPLAAEAQENRRREEQLR